jgi:hypothetical protein
MVHIHSKYIPASLSSFRLAFATVLRARKSMHMSRHLLSTEWNPSSILLCYTTHYVTDLVPDTTVPKYVGLCVDDAGSNLCLILSFSNTSSSTMMPLNLALDALIFGRHLLHDHVSSHRDLLEMMTTFAVLR